MSDVSVVFTTLPGLAIAEEIASKLVEENLVACINISSPMRSIYKWEGQLNRSDEYLLMIKVSSSGLQALEKRLKELHPYQVFEFIALNSSYVNAPYLEWVKQSC